MEHLALEPSLQRPEFCPVAQQPCECARRSSNQPDVTQQMRLQRVRQ